MTTPASGAERCPVDHGMMQTLWRENGPALNELTQVIAPLSVAVSNAIEADLEHGDAVSIWPGQRETVITGGLPYSGDLHSDPYRVLPPTLFADKQPEIPQTEAERSALVADYLAAAGEDSAFDIEAKIYFGRELLAALQLLAENGTQIDEAKWLAYARAAQMQPEGNAHLAHMIGFRATNVSDMLGVPEVASLLTQTATGRFSEYMYCSNVALHNDSIQSGVDAVRGYLILPVGAYGAFTEQLLRTTLYSVERANQILPQHATAAVAGHEQAIGKYTSRGRERGRDAIDAASALITDGIFTVAQTASQMTAEKVVGYDSLAQLVGALAEQGLITEFARAIPKGLIGPFTLGGAFFPGLVQNPSGKPNGKLRLNPEIMSTIKAAKRTQITGHFSSWLDWIWAEKHTTHGGSSIRLGTTGTDLVCPAAMPAGGLQQLSVAMAHALESIPPPRKPRALKTMARVALTKIFPSFGRKTQPSSST